MARLTSAAVLLLVALGAAAAARPPAHRRALAQVTTNTPVSITGTPQTPAPGQAAPPVEEQSFGAAALLAKEALAAKAAALSPAPAPAAAPAPIVVLPAPAPQVASLPTTLGGPLQISTSTPVTVSSPITVKTPVKQVNGQKAIGLGLGHLLLPDPSSVALVVAACAIAVSNALGAVANILPPIVG